MIFFSVKEIEVMFVMTEETIFSGIDQTDEMIGTVIEEGLELHLEIVDQNGSQRGVSTSL